jgi:hypothetical protein
MRPKPEHDAYRRELCRVLTASLARVRPTLRWPRADASRCLTLVSWTVHFYDEHRDIALDLPGIQRLLEQPEPSARDLHDVGACGRRLARVWRLLGDAMPALGRMIAKPDLRRTMAEAARYQRDENGIGTTIRGMLKAVIEEAWRRGERILLIGHSLGSVIAYDTLWELSHASGSSRERPRDARIDLFMTLGSPLASRFIRGQLAGSAQRDERRYPTLVRRWENFAARADMTAFRPTLRPYFDGMLRLGLTEAIVDHVGLYNHFRGDIGLNPHEAYGYLNHHLVAERIAAWLEETA